MSNNQAAVEEFFDQFTRGGTGFAVRALYPFTAMGLASVGPFSLEDARLGLEYRAPLAASRR